MKIDRETPAHLDLHLILDNYVTHKTPAVKRWLARHKRFTLHFTPTSCSWLNLVERLFAEITRQRIRRGTFNDVTELKTAIDRIADGAFSVARGDAQKAWRDAIPNLMAKTPTN